MTEASGSGEEPGGGFEGWKGVPLSLEGEEGGEESKHWEARRSLLVTWGFSQGQWELLSIFVILQCPFPL